MSTITKDLGVVTAYGYYKAGGGTMTESEFTQFMVDFGAASKTATEAAQAAAESAQTSAAHSADAQDSAEEARQSASIASARAIEADTAAGASIDAKNDAVTAQTAAQTAKTQAESARDEAQECATRAETAAESIDFGLDPVPTQDSTNAVSSGGVYEALHNTDTTLSQSGQAADAKVVGDEVDGLKADLSDEQAIIGNYEETFKNVSYFPRLNDLFVVEDDVLTLKRNSGGSNWATASFPVSAQHKYIILVDSDNALEISSYKFTDTNATSSGDINGTRFDKKATVESTTYNFLRLFFQITSLTPDTTITVHVLDITDTISDAVTHISTVLQPVNLIDIAKATDGYYVNYSSGNLSSNSNYLASDFISVEPDNYYTLSVYTASYGVGQMAWYDAKKAYISGLANSGINTSVSVKAPENASYLRWSINKAIKDSTQLQAGKLSTAYTTKEYKIPSKYIPDKESFVTVGTGGTYRTILQALKDTDDKIKIKVLYGTYDLVQEYTSYYGSDFWANYAGYASSDDPFMRGLWVTNGREIEFDQRAVVTFLPNIENANIASYFSPFAIGYNAKITGLTLQYSGCRYAVHDDFATAPGKNEYINCRFDGNPSSGAVIGAGCGSNNSYIIDGCVFINNNGKYDISYHNGSGSYNKNLIVVKNSYGTKKCSFRWYGNSDLITDCIVSACKFGTIECVPHSYAPNEKENMKLYSFCNEGEE